MLLYFFTKAIQRTTKEPESNNSQQRKRNICINMNNTVNAQDILSYRFAQYKFNMSFSLDWTLHKIWHLENEAHSPTTIASNFGVNMTTQLLVKTNNNPDFIGYRPPYNLLTWFTD